MASLDTSTAAASLHEESYRQLGPAGRFKLAVELSDLTHALAVAGLRRRNPDLSDEDARRRLAEVLYISGASHQE
jgi:hypothetical protein